MADRDYTIVHPDGREITITGPDNASADQLRMAAEKAFASVPAAPAVQKSEPTQSTTWQQRLLSDLGNATGLPQLAKSLITGDPKDVAAVAAAPAVRFAVGAGAPIIGIADRLAGNSGVVQGFNRLAQEGGASTGLGDVAGIAGSVLNPLGLAAAKAIPLASTMTGKTLQGVGMGATGGFLAPAENNTEAASNALVGASIGGVLPPVVQGIGAAANLIGNKLVRPIADLFTAEGPTNIARKYVINKAVGPAQMPAVLQNTANVQPTVPNYPATVAEAVASLPEGSPLVRLQTLTAQSPGGVSAKFGQRIQDQDAAIQAAKDARSAMSAANYAKAFDTTINDIKADPTLAVLAQNPYFKDAIPAALKLAQAKGITPKDNLTEFLHAVKLGLDKKLNPGLGEVSLDKAQYTEVQKVKDQLVDWLKKNPDYEAGRAAHAQASQAIQAAIDRRDLAIAPKQTTNLAGGINVAEETRPHMPNLLSRPAMALNFLLRKAGKDVEPKVDAAMAEILLDPAKFTQVMSQLPPKTQVDVQKALQRANAFSFGAANAMGAQQR